MLGTHSIIRGVMVVLLSSALLAPLNALAAMAPDCQPVDVHLVEEANWPPFTLESGGLATRGLSYELMRLIFGHLQRCASIELLPQARMLEMARSGRADGITVISRNAERETFLSYTQTPLLVRRAFIYYRSDRPQPIAMRDWNDLRGLRLGIVRGRNYPPAFAEARQQGVFEVVELVTASQMFDMLLRGRIDALPALDLEAGEFFADPQYRAHIVASQYPYAEYPYYVAVARASSLMQDLPALNQAIVELQRNGALAKVLKRYGL